MTHVQPKNVCSARDQFPNLSGFSVAGPSVQMIFVFRIF